MAKYLVRMLDSISGAEGAYQFTHRDELMDGPADDVVGAFFDYAQREIFERTHLAYEINGVIKNKKAKTVVAIGQLHHAERPDEDLQPFTIFIAKA
ncbi:MAG: hypothetical protein AB7L65_08735 [Hyphomonadaceae bacterium]